MTAYTLTVSTADLGLGILSNVRITVNRKLTTVSNVFPSANLVLLETTTNGSGVAEVSLYPDDSTVFHELRIYNVKGVVIYSQAFTMPPQNIALDLLPLQDIISASAGQAVAAAVATAADRVQTGLDAASIIVATKKFSTYAEQMSYTGDYIDGQKCDVLSYYALGDGGFIPMYWSASSTATHNEGTVRKPTSVSGAGRWLAVNKFELNVQQFGARGDGVNNDYAAITNCLAAGGAGSTVIFPYTGAAYLISQGLKFYAGQKLIGGGGVNILTTATQIKLTAISTSVLESITPASVNYGSEIKGLYLNGQGFCDAVLNLYNCNRSNVEDVACNTTKAGSCGILFDSNVSLFCYANQVKNPRIYANGVGSVGMRFTRGANINQIWGGSVVSSTRGMEFLSLSSGNLVVGTDFEENVTDHIYVDAPNNIFIGTHMETCPIGFNITALGVNTQRMNTSYSTSTVINVQDASKIGTVLDTRLESGGTYGDLRFGGSKYKTTLNSVTTTEDHDLTPATGSSNALFRWFLNTVTTGIRKLVFYKGDGTNTATASIDAATGEYQCSDLIQENGQGNGLYRKTIRRSVAPTTGTWNQGDICNFIGPISGGYVGAVCTVSGTPGTWKNYGLIT